MIWRKFVLQVGGINCWFGYPQDTENIVSNHNYDQHADMQGILLTHFDNCHCPHFGWEVLESGLRQSVRYNEKVSIVFEHAVCLQQVILHIIKIILETQKCIEQC
jgi:hypothetical protein